jgi:hypothetical protein
LDRSAKTREIFGHAQVRGAGRLVRTAGAHPFFLSPALKISNFVFGLGASGRVPSCVVSVALAIEGR